MKNISLKRNIKLVSDKKDSEYYELFSLKIADSLYKKDIGKFLETLEDEDDVQNVYTNVNFEG